MTLPVDTEVAERLAIEVAYGYPKATIARTHGFSSTVTLNAILENEDMKALVDEKKRMVELGAQSLVAKLSLHSHKVLDNVVRLAEDPDHPKMLNAATYILDKLIPNIQKSESEIHHTVDAELTGQLLVGIAELRAVQSQSHSMVPIEHDPHLHDGRELMESRDRESERARGSPED